MADYYRINRRKISLREYWGISPTWKIIIPWTAARLGLRSDENCMCIPDSVRDMEVPETEFFEMARTSLQPMLDEAVRLGFHSPRFYSFQSVRRDTRVSIISLQHRSGESSIRLSHSMSTIIVPPRERRTIAILSELNDGTYLVSTDQRATFKVAPGVAVNRLIGAPLARLAESHEQRLTESRWQNPAKPIRSQEALEDVWDRYEKHINGFNMKRGLYARMSPEEVAAELQIVSTADIMAQAGPENADVLMQLAKIQNRKSSWRGAIWLLIISALLFIFTGSQRWSWGFVVILVPALFVHELGHYVAMRVFRYRNLRMFFIPLFGAAVSGRHFNVAGWKKAVVSLMGPVPGIILGAAIGGIGFVLQNALLMKIAMVALVLNGFNLLPLLPFDGGWVFHALLFSRHYLIDAAFRTVAAIGLFGVGLLTHSKILMYLSIPMAMAIPRAYRLSKIAADLRQRGLPPTSPDDQTIPAETAKAIITEVRKTMPTTTYTTKMVAERTLEVFEMINSRPPNWLATAGLLGAHVASIGLAAAMAFFLVFGRTSRLESFVSRMSAEPQRPLASSVLPGWQGPKAGLSAPVTIVGDFKTEAKAVATFASLTNQLPDTATLKQMGQTLLLALPGDDLAGRKKWMGAMKRQAKTAFLATKEPGVSFSFTCQFPTEQQAKSTGDELAEYVDVDTTHSLIPPWLPDDPRTPEERAAHRLARQTYLKAQRAGAESSEDPELTELREQFIHAARAKDQVRVKEFSEKMARRRMEIAAEKREELKTGNEGPVDTAVIDLYSAYVASAGSNAPEKSINAQLASRMGAMPKMSGTGAIDDRYLLFFASSSVKAKMLKVTWASFPQPAEGAPAFLHWLADHGATDFKYDVVTAEDD